MDNTDMYRLEGRVAVVTGAAGGIGTAISRRLAELGAQVVLADVSESVAKTAKEIAAEGGDAEGQYELFRLLRKTAASVQERREAAHAACCH